MCEGVHLHVHSEESVLDGLTKVKDLVLKAKSLGQTALGITDHGVCGAIPDFITACLEHGIKPIPGCEVYMTKDRTIQATELEKKRKDLCTKYKITDKKGKPKLKVLRDFLRKVEKDYSCFEREANIILKDYLMSDNTPVAEEFDIFSINEVNMQEKAPEKPLDKMGEFKKDIFDYLDLGNFHMVLLAINNKGLEDLYAIVSDAHLNGFHSDPRTDLTYIRDHHLGSNIIATSACLGSYFSQLCLAGRLDDAKRHIQEAKDTFHSFYLEKQATLVPAQLYLNDIIDQLAIETNTPKILTSDVHYANEDDFGIHDVLVTSSIGKCISDPDRMIYAHEYWMKSDQEMMEKCNDPEAWGNTLKIAEMVDISLPKEPLLPKFPVEEGDSVDEILKKKAWDGLFQLALKENIDIDLYSKRLQTELDVIVPQGFSDYFLVVSDYLSWAKDNDHIVGPGRGSAAGSLVAMCLRITSIDPIKYNLMFERFLSPDRISFPDIDSDLPYEACLAVQEHMKEKYGRDRVAQIGTKGTLAARAVCRRVGKTLGFDNPTQDKFAKAIPSRPGIKLREAHEEVETVRQFAQAFPQWWEAMLALEGHISQVGTHAGGIVLSPEPLTKVTPLRLDSDDLQTTQFDMKWIEKFLVKFDILKLDTMGLIKKTMQYAGIWGEVDIEDIDLNDPKIYADVYNSLNLSGIFQVESDGMKDVIRELKPDCFEDIVAILALYRPGPMDFIPTYIKRKHGKEKVVYDFPECEDILKDTYGVLVYQEQAMKMSVRLGGLSNGQSDYIRAGIAKKKMNLIDEWVGDMIYGNEEKNIVGALSKGYTEEQMLKLKEEWTKFGEYCFNRSHSVAYAKISLMTAYLKCYYPVEFMAALLSNSEGKKDKNQNPRNVYYMRMCEEMGIKILPPDINQSYADWTPLRYNTMVLDQDNKGWIGEIRYGLSSIGSVSGESVYEVMNNRPYKSVEDLVAKTNGTKVNKTKVVALIKSGSFDNITKNRNLLLRNYYHSRNESYGDIPAQTSKVNILNYEREVFGVAISTRSRWETIADGATTQITGTVQSIETWVAQRSGKTHYKVIVETKEEPIEVTVWGYLMEKYEEVVVGSKVNVKGEKSRDKLTAKTINVVQDKFEVDLQEGVYA